MGLDLVYQNGSAPSLCDVLRDIPFAQLGVVDFVEKFDDVAPGQLANGSLADCVLVGPGLGEPPHVLKVGGRESLRVEKLRAQIHG